MPQPSSVCVVGRPGASPVFELKTEHTDGCRNPIRYPSRQADATRSACLQRACKQALHRNTYCGAVRGSSICSTTITKHRTHHDRMKRLLFLCCLCLLAIRPVTSVKQTERVGKQQRPIAVRVRWDCRAALLLHCPPPSQLRSLGPPSRSPEHTLLVSLANGKVVALDKNTGAKLWTFDSGAPLLTSTNPAQLGSASDVGGTGVRSVGSIFPGTDGSLYSYLAADDESPRIEVSSSLCSLCSKRFRCAAPPHLCCHV